MENDNATVFIDRQLSRKILTLGVSKTTFGGMAAVVASYEKCFARMRFIPTWRLGNKTVKAWYAVRAVIRCCLLLLFDRRIKILHIHGAANASFYRKAIFIGMGKRFGKKVILHQHAADFKEFFAQNKNQSAIRDTLNLCDRLIVLSRSWKEYFAAIGVAEEKIRVLNNIVFPPGKAATRAADGKLHLLWLGEISKRKGIGDLLHVLNDNREYFDGKALLRVGGNVVDGDTGLPSGAGGPDSSVRYEGWVAGAKKAECWEWADVYILPSYREGLPVAVLEAMSYARPVIASRAGGIPEILHTHENGILIEAGNREEIKNAIAFFIEHPEKISEYGAAAYQTVQPFFPERVFKQLKAVYHELL